MQPIRRPLTVDRWYNVTMETVENGTTKPPREWHREKVQWQNPRIRALLGSVRSLDDVLESDFALLHCSPTRLLEIWDTVRTVCWVVQTKITPSMEQPSVLPDLDEAIRNARATLNFFHSEVFAHLEPFSECPDEHQFDELRRSLCITIGKLHGFLFDTLGKILAADPRNHHDVDYFIARRFPRDVEESEWLQTSVSGLNCDLASLNERCQAGLGSIIDEIETSNRLPSPEAMPRLAAFLDELELEFAPKLKTIAGLRAIRFADLEVLQVHARDLPESCRAITDLIATSRVVLDSLTESLGGNDNQETRRVTADVERTLCLRIITRLRGVIDELRDLTIFVSLWLSCINNRRALLLQAKDDDADHGGQD